MNRQWGVGEGVQGFPTREEQQMSKELGAGRLLEELSSFRDERELAKEEEEGRSRL